MAPGVVVFDAYGTLFDIHGAARRAARRHPRLVSVWPEVSDNWRRKQLEYSWLRSLTGQHADFWTLTQDALDWALAAAQIDDAALRAELLSLYRGLPAYPEVPQMLDRLAEAGWARAIFSNGTNEMLACALESSGLDGRVGTVLSVEPAGIFKPAAAAYARVTAAFACPPGDITFVSGNGWDIYGAARFGFRTVWINRSGQPPERLPARPDLTLPDLTRLPETLT